MAPHRSARPVDDHRPLSVINRLSIRKSPWTRLSPRTATSQEDSISAKPWR